MSKPEHDPYPLDEAAELTGNAVRTLISAAAKGRLQIYVMAKQWRAACIYGIRQAVTEASSVKIVGVSGAPSAMDNTDTLDITTGNRTIYGRLGPTRSLYLLEPNDLEPVATHCFTKYLVEPTSAEVEIDINKKTAAPDKDIRLYFRPAPPVLVGEALKQGLLFVMASDLGEMRGHDNGGVLTDYYDDPRWQTTELGIAVQAWNSVRNSIKEGEKPGVKLREWLNNYNRITGDKLSDSAIDRIATIANWDKSPGAARKKGLE